MDPALISKVDYVKIMSYYNFTLILLIGRIFYLVFFLFMIQLCSQVFLIGNYYEYNCSLLCRTSRNSQLMRWSPKVKCSQWNGVYGNSLIRSLLKRNVPKNTNGNCSFSQCPALTHISQSLRTNCSRVSWLSFVLHS